MQIATGKTTSGSARSESGPLRVCDGSTQSSFFVPVTDGEMLLAGDEYLDPKSGEWYRSKCAGKRVGVVNCTDLEYRRFMPPNAI